MGRIYCCIDLKSFYASVECVERGLDPLTTNLVVADSTRTEKTICLAVSPSLKQYGIPGRARLYEVVQKVNKINSIRRKSSYYKFSGKSYDDNELKKHKNYELDYIVAIPRMSLYIKYSTQIYNIYLKYISAEDILVYSIDEVFCDITDYLSYYKLTPKQLVTKIIHDVYNTTGITATAGLGTNMYLAKVAMDIVAKHCSADKNGVRMAALDEMKYRKLLWSHKPITDFWRVGKGYSKKLADHGIFTMGDVARVSIENEELLYKLFGVNAELLIDHAWGYEPCTMSVAKSYKPVSNSISSGQVLHCAYNFNKAKLIVSEMCDSLSLDLVKRGVITNQLVLNVGYDISNLSGDSDEAYDGDITTDYYGRKVPKPAHGTVNLNHKTSSSKIIRNSVVDLYNRIVDKKLLIKRINLFANNIVDESLVNDEVIYEQFDLFSDSVKVDEDNKKNKVDEEYERMLQKTMLNIKDKYGKNSILRGMNFLDGATAIDRNKQIGGHKE